MIIMDVEASGLSTDSYPIEVAWQHRFISSRHDSFLIKPVDTWIYWDAYAEHHVHRISRATLQTQGLSVIEAASRLNDALQGQIVYTDAVTHDRQWIKCLFNTSHIEMNFRMHCVYSLVEPAKVEPFKKRQAELKIEHRALPDARAIVSTLNYFC